MFDRLNNNFKEVSERKSYYTKPGDIIEDVLFYAKYTEGFLSDLDYLFNSGCAAEQLSKKLKKIKQGDQIVSNNLLDYDLAIQILNYDKPEKFKNVLDILVGFLISTQSIERKRVEEFIEKVNAPTILSELSKSIVTYYSNDLDLFVVRDFFEEYKEYKYIVHRFRLFLELLDIDLSEFYEKYNENNPFNALAFIDLGNPEYTLFTEMAVVLAYETVMFSPEYKEANKHDEFVKIAYGLMNSDRSCSSPVRVFADLLKDNEAEENKRYFEFLSVFVDAYKIMFNKGKGGSDLINYVSKNFTDIIFREFPQEDEYWTQNNWL